MRKENGLRKKYNRICNWFSIRNMSWMAIGLFVILMIPVCYLSFVNRASGDDYGYGAYTRAAWMATGSVWEVIKAAWVTIKQYYYGWQGTWFSIFLFALQPEVFHDKAYVIVAFLMLFLWIVSTIVLFKEILLRKIKFTPWSVRLITVVFLIIGIQFIPSTKSAIFWYNGCAHYLVPFAMGQFLISLLVRFGDRYRKREFIGICIVMTLLGGSNYQAALFAFVALIYAIVQGYVEKKEKKIFLLLVPLALELVGLFVSIVAPGNKVRGGEEFGFSLPKIVETVGLSFWYGMKDVGSYLTEKPLVFVGLLLLILVCFEAFKEREKCEKMCHPMVRIVALICLYSAMQAPAIYAGVEVSRGVLNMNFQVFLLTTMGVILIITERISIKLKQEKSAYHQRILLPGLILLLGLVVVFRGNVKTTTSYISLEYIVSGQAADYKMQMEQQTALLEGAETHVVLPFINDEQGPLMHMPVTDNPDAWTNWIACEFYEKESVVAMPRPQWNELYENKVQ